MGSHYVPHTKTPTLVFPTSAQAARLSLAAAGLDRAAARPTPVRRQAPLPGGLDGMTFRPGGEGGGRP